MRLRSATDPPKETREISNKGAENRLRDLTARQEGCTRLSGGGEKVAFVCFDFRDMITWWRSFRLRTLLLFHLGYKLRDLVLFLLILKPQAMAS